MSDDSEDVVVVVAAADAADNREEEDADARSSSCTGAVGDSPPAPADAATADKSGVVVDDVRLPRVVSVLGVAHVHSVEGGAGTHNTAVVVVRPPGHGMLSNDADDVAIDAGARDSVVEEEDSVDALAGMATVDRADAAADNTDQNRCDVWDWSDDEAATGEDRPPDPPIVPPDEKMRRSRGVAEHRLVPRPGGGADDAVLVDNAEEEEGVSHTDADDSPRSGDLLLMRTW